MNRFLNLILCLPPIALAVDLWISASNLMMQFNRQNNNARAVISKNIPLAPEDIQMVQVIGNFGMALIVTLGIFTLILLNNRVSNKQSFQLTGWFIVGLLIVVAYTLPGLWTSFWATVHIFTYGSFPLSWAPLWNAIIALFLPYTIVLLLIRLSGYFRQNRTRRAIGYNT